MINHCRERHISVPQSAPATPPDRRVRAARSDPAVSTQSVHHREPET